MREPDAATAAGQTTSIGGLPDRDYYLKDDPKLKDYREKYVAFLTTILQLAGDRSGEFVGHPFYGVPP